MNKTLKAEQIIEQQAQLDLQKKLLESSQSVNRSLPRLIFVEFALSYLCVLDAPVVAAILVALAAVFAAAFILIGSKIEKNPNWSPDKREFAKSCSYGIAQSLLAVFISCHFNGAPEALAGTAFALAILCAYRNWRIAVAATTLTLVFELTALLLFAWQKGSFGDMLGALRMSVIFYAVEMFTFSILSEYLKLRLYQDSRKQAATKYISEVENTHRNEMRQLHDSHIWESMQFQLTKKLANTTTWHGALPSILRFIADCLPEGRGNIWAAYWCNDEDRLLLESAWQVQLPSNSFEQLENCSRSHQFKRSQGIPGKVWATMKPLLIKSGMFSANDTRSHAEEFEAALNGIAFPLRDKDRFFGVVELYSDKPAFWNATVLESIGRDIGKFISRKEVDSSREHLSNIVENASDAILLISPDNEIVGWNHGAEMIFGYRPAQIIGLDLSILIPPKQSEELGRLLRATIISNERVEGYETTLVTMSEQLVEVLVYTIPCLNASGRYDGCSITMHNITERKTAERRVSEFYSMVSHELRTPLTSIRGILGLIESGTIESGTPECEELIIMARSSSDRLIRLINDMLDLKKIESGKMELRRSKVEVSELVTCATMDLQGMSEEYSATIKYERTGGRKYFVYADWDKIMQVLVNLASNAIKFSSPNALVRVVAEPATSNSIRFRVIDNGPGISADDLKKLFQKFQQLDSSDARAVGGSGLGLAISKALVEEHGGKVGVKSVVGQGSEFWFELPEYVDRESETPVDEIFAPSDWEERETRNSLLKQHSFHNN